MDVGRLDGWDDGRSCGGEPRRATGPEQRFSDDLVGLDPNDPEARAFAEHLDRIERERAGFTVEGYLGGISDFADSANRAAGHRRMVAVLLVLLILLGVAVAVWDTLGQVLSALLA